MLKETEEIVTKILAKREILHTKQFAFVSNPNYDLGEFLQNYVPEPKDTRFVFIK